MFICRAVVKQAQPGNMVDLHVVCWLKLNPITSKGGTVNIKELLQAGSPRSLHHFKHPIKAWPRAQLFSIKMTDNRKPWQLRQPPD
jgi:hypothetical protein